ncbi:MAG: hypothetical protein HRU27_06510 [Rhizobiaceae bacterium]|nr:hypothetical protein [Rhizobiaceae bacterium]
MEAELPRSVHLVGSVPLSDAAEVMSTCCGVLGKQLRRVPDGETGERTNWIQWQRDILGAHEAIEVVGEGKNAQTVMPRFALRPGFTGEVAFSDLGYLSAALESYATFRQLKDSGEVAGQRFQVSLPTPLAAIACYVDSSSQEALFAPYRDQLLIETDAILDQIPHEDLAIQWDVAIEFAVLEGLFPVWFSSPFEAITEQLSDLIDRIPDSVEAGFHFCYGDANNKHFKEPEDMGLLVSLANAVCGSAKRSVDWIHMPVPFDRSDDAYFQPLAGLNRDGLSELYLGLLHEQDGVEGAGQRMAAADKFVSDYGVATECGLGRRNPTTIPDLLKLHAAV